MKPMRLALRVWIATASLIGFLGGWVLLAHAPKPAPLVTNTPTSAEVSLPPLPTLPPLGDGSVQLQPLTSLPQNFGAFSRMRTRGS
jgi:hypothetical protein